MVYFQLHWAVTFENVPKTFLESIFVEKFVTDAKTSYQLHVVKQISAFKTFVKTGRQPSKTCSGVQNCNKNFVLHNSYTVIIIIQCLDIP